MAKEATRTTPIVSVTPTAVRRFGSSNRVHVSVEKLERPSQFLPLCGGVYAHLLQVFDEGTVNCPSCLRLMRERGL